MTALITTAAEAARVHPFPNPMPFPAYRLCRVGMVNWYLYAAKDLEINGSTVLMGNNGTGKSVVLDAIQTVQTGNNQHFLSLNARATDGGHNRKRSVLDYCLGVMDDGDEPERPDGCPTYLMLGYEPSLDDEGRHPPVTFGMAFDVKPGSLSAARYFIIEGALLSAERDVVAANDDILDWNAFKAMIEAKGRVEYPRNSESFCKQMLHHLNRNDEGGAPNVNRWRRAIKQSVEFRIERMRSVTDFTRKFVLDEHPLDVSMFQRRYEVWKGLNDRLVQIEQEIADGVALEKDARQARHRELVYARDRWIARRAKLDHLRQQITKRRTELGEKEAEIARLDAAVAKGNELIDAERKERDRLQSILDNSAEAVQIQRLEAQNLGFDRDLEKARKPLDDLQAGLGSLRAMRGTASDGWSDSGFKQLQASLSSLLAGDPIGGGWPRHPAALLRWVASVPPMEPVRDRLQAQELQAGAEVQRLVDALADARSRLDGVDGKVARRIGARTERFVSALAATGIRARVFAEVVRVRAGFEAWRGITETILGAWCEAVIVAPADYRKALSVLRRGGRDGDGFPGCKMVQTTRSHEMHEALRDDSLAAVLETDDEHAQAFILARLNGIRRVVDEAELATVQRGATEDGVYVSGFGTERRDLSNLLPMLGAVDPRLLEDGITRQISKLTDQLKTARNDYAAVRAEGQRLAEFMAALTAAYDNLEETLKRVESLEYTMTRNAEAIDALRRQQDPELQQQIEDFKASIDERREEVRQAGFRKEELLPGIGRLKEGIETSERDHQQLAPGFAELTRELRGGLREARRTYNEEQTTSRSLLDTSLDKGNRERSNANQMRDAHSVLRDSLRGFIERWSPPHSFQRSDAPPAAVTVWIGAHLGTLRTHGLLRQKKKVRRAMKALLESAVTDFITRLKEQFVMMRQKIRDLNRRLENSVFNNELYEFHYSQVDSLSYVVHLTEQFHELQVKLSPLFAHKQLLAPEAPLLADGGLFDEDDDGEEVDSPLIQLIDMGDELVKHPDPLFANLGRLLSTLTGKDSAVTAEPGGDMLSKLSDYREYFAFEIDVKNATTKAKMAQVSSRLGKASGGESYVPFYIIIGTAMASACFDHIRHRHAVRPQSSVILLDEAFEKLDPGNRLEVIRYLHGLGLQLVVAAPRGARAVYKETMGTIVDVMRYGRTAAMEVLYVGQASRDVLAAENPFNRRREMLGDEA